MNSFSPRLSSIAVDPLSRVMAFVSGLFAMAALTLSIVGTATYSWYSSYDAQGNTKYYNLFTYCTGNLLNQSSTCIDMPRGTDLGLGTQHAGALLVVALCFLGCGMFMTFAMACMQLSGVLAFVSPVLLFLAALFMLAAFAEGSRVTIYNSYSANLVQTGHLLTIFSMGLTAFAGGRSHAHYYEAF